MTTSILNSVLPCATLGYSVPFPQPFILIDPVYTPSIIPTVRSGGSVGVMQSPGTHACTDVILPHQGTWDGQPQDVVGLEGLQHGIDDLVQQLEYTTDSLMALTDISGVQLQSQRGHTHRSPSTGIDRLGIQVKCDNENEEVHISDGTVYWDPKGRSFTKYSLPYDKGKVDVYPSSRPGFLEIFVENPETKDDVDHRQSETGRNSRQWTRTENLSASAWANNHGLDAEGGRRAENPSGVPITRPRWTEDSYRQPSRAGNEDRVKRCFTPPPLSSQRSSSGPFVHSSNKPKPAAFEDEVYGDSSAPMNRVRYCEVRRTPGGDIQLDEDARGLGLGDSDTSYDMPHSSRSPGHRRRY